MAKRKVLECVFNRAHTVIIKDHRPYCLECEAFSVVERVLDE